MTSTERRYTPVPVELRVQADRQRIGGYASLFGVLSRNLGGFVEQVMPSAFNKSRSDGWSGVLARYNHDDNFLLGTTAARTLELTIDETGLRYVVDPPQSRTDILELVARGDVRHSSFAFRVMPNGEEWATTDQGYPMRMLNQVQLVDVAPVNNPAYADTTAAMRSLAEHMGVPLEEVRSLAEADELRKFFVRTDKQGRPKPVKPKTFGPVAVAELLANRDDPWGDVAV